MTFQTGQTKWDGGSIRNGNSVTWLTRDGVVVVPHLKHESGMC